MSLVQGLLSHYTLNETNGTRFDSHGSNDLQTVSGAGVGVDWAGKIDSASLFWEADYLQTNDPAVFKFGANPFTISAWIKPQVLQTGSSVQRIFIDKANGSFGREFRLCWYNGNLSNTLADGSYFRFWIFDEQDQIVEAAALDVVPIINIWYHMVMWHDTERNKIGIRINNGTVYETDFNGSLNTPTPGSKFAIGSKSEISGAYNPNVKLKGSFDEMAIWNRALSVTDRDLLWNNGNALAYNQFANVGDNVGPPPPPPSGSQTFGDLDVAYDDAVNLDFGIMTNPAILDKATVISLRDYLNSWLDL